MRKEKEKKVTGQAQKKAGSGMSPRRAPGTVYLRHGSGQSERFDKSI